VTQTDALEFKRAAETDYPLVVSVIRDAFMPVAERMGVTEEDVPRYAAFESVPRLTMWIAEHSVHMFLLFENGCPVGCGGCSPDITDARKGWLNRIAVRPSCQGKGYGKVVVTSLEDELRRQGYTRARLGHVSPDHKLHTFYQRLGYETAHVEPSKTWGMEITYMEKDL
jgi:diamine N-acetyltransferase